MTENEIEAESQDGGVVKKGKNSMEEGCAPDRSIFDSDIGELEAHADGKRVVGKVEVVGRLVAREAQSAPFALCVTNQALRTAHRQLTRRIFPRSVPKSNESRHADTRASRGATRQA